MVVDGSAEVDGSLEIDGRILRYSRYGPPDGFPVIWHTGTPSTRWKRPDLIEAIQQSGARVLVPDRPGYGGSTRLPGRTVADVVPDVRALADAQGWSRFAVLGGSGGGPHALACAALLPQRVTRCAVLSGIKPAVTGPAVTEPAVTGPAVTEPAVTGPAGAAAPPPDEEALRSRLAQIGRDWMARIADGAPEVPDPPDGPPARDDPAALARLRATFVDSHDGWVDDTLAFARPWGFPLPDGTVPIGVWHGTHDANVPPEHAQWLLANLPGSQGHQYAGGHLPGADIYREIYSWLRAEAA